MNQPFLGGSALRRVAANRTSEIADNTRYLFEGLAGLNRGRSPGHTVPALHHPIVHHQETALNRVHAFFRRAAEQEADDAIVVAQIAMQLIEYTDPALTAFQTLSNCGKTQGRSVRGLRAVSRPVLQNQQTRIAEPIYEEDNRE